MDDSTRTATRLGCAALLACARSVTGCSMDSMGIIHWTQPPSDSAYAEPRIVDDWRAYYWHGQRSAVRGGGFGVRPRIDTSKLKSSAPK